MNANFSTYDVELVMPIARLRCRASALFLPNHVNVHQSLIHERFAATAEVRLEIKLLSLTLRAYLYFPGTELFLCHAYRLAENLQPVALAALAGDDAPDGNLVEIGASLQHPGVCHHLAVDVHPQVDGILVHVVEVEIHAVLLHDEYFGARLQYHVKFVERKLMKSLADYFLHFLVLIFNCVNGMQR